MAKYRTPKLFLFDFGNVIVNIDFQRMNQAFQELLGADFDRIYTQLKDHNFFEQVESSDWSAKDMANFVNQFGVSVSPDEIKQAWNALLLDIPDNRLRLLEVLSSKHSIAMLSNTNRVHIEELFSRFEQNYGFNPITTYFTHLFLSYKMGYIKPQNEIYQLVLDELKLDADEILFFDDLEQNIKAASNMGMQTQLVTKDYGIVDYFREYPV